MFVAEKRHNAPKWFVFPLGLLGLSEPVSVFPRVWSLDKSSYPEQYHHLSRVSRMRVGEHVVLVDCLASRRYNATVQLIDKEHVAFDVFSQEPIVPKPQHKLEACCAVIKLDRWEWMIEKLVELGVGRIQPVVTKNTQRQYVEKLMKPKYQARLLDIVVQTAQQCEQDNLPVILPPLAIASIPACDEKKIGFVLSERGDGIRFKTALENGVEMIPEALETVRFVIGPEGGWVSTELDHLKEKGYHSITITGNILRAETASIYAASLLSEYCVS